MPIQFIICQAFVLFQRVDHHSIIYLHIFCCADLLHCNLDKVFTCHNIQVCIVVHVSQNWHKGLSRFHLIFFLKYNNLKSLKLEIYVNFTGQQRNVLARCTVHTANHILQYWHPKLHNMLGRKTTTTTIKNIL